MALVNFNKPGQRLPAAAVGPAYQAGLTNINEFAPNQDMADALLKRGSSTAPVQSVQEGIYRALTGGVGGFIKGRDKRQLQSQKDAYGEAVMKALMASTPTEGTVGKAERIVTPMAPASPPPSSFAPDLAMEPPPPSSVAPDLAMEPPTAAPASILDDPSVPDVASLGLERIETPTGPGGQIIEQQYVPGTPGTPGGLQAMVDSLRGDGTRDPGLQSALNQTALTMQYGGLQDKAALDAAQAQFNRDMELKKAGIKPTTPSGTMAMYLLAKEQEQDLTVAEFYERNKNPAFNVNARRDELVVNRYETATKEIGEINDETYQIEEMIGLVEAASATGVSTGAFANLRNDIKKIALAFGVDVNENQIANFEAMKSGGMAFVLKLISKTKGAISEKEMDAFEQASAGVRNTPEGNKRILALARHNLRRKRARAEAMQQAASKDGATPVSIDKAGAAALKQFEEDMEFLPPILLGIGNSVEDPMTQAEWSGMSPDQKNRYVKAAREMVAGGRP